MAAEGERSFAPARQAPARREVVIYPPALRLVMGVAQGTAGLNLFYFALRWAHDLATGELTTPMAVIVRGLVVLSLVPASFVRLGRRLAKGTLTAHEDRLEIHGRYERHEIPRPALASIRPWRLPLPGPGVSLRWRAPRRARRELEVSDPWILAAALEGKGDPHHTEQRPHLRGYLTARAAYRRADRGRLVLRFGLYPLLLTFVWFWAHQHIAFGGLFGEYYLFGGGAYVRTLVRLWIESTTQLVLYAGLWRAFGETAVLAGSLLWERQAALLRRAAEVLLALVYYLGIPAYVAASFLG